MKVKYCPDCQEWKEAERFHRDPSHSDGLSTRCKRCHNIRCQTSGEEYADRMVAILHLKARDY